MKTFFRLLSICVVAIAILAPSAFCSGPSAYKLENKINLPGDGGWDYISFDPQGERIFISRATHVMVVDAAGKVLGDIPNTQGVHGIALAHKYNKGFISCGKSNEVVVFDLKSLKELARVPTGQGPDAIIFDPATERVFSMNGHGGSTTAINAKDNTVAGTVDLFCQWLG